MEQQTSILSKILPWLVLILVTLGILYLIQTGTG